MRILVPTLRVGMPSWTLCVRSIGKASVLVRRRGASGRAFPRGAWEREVKAFVVFDLSPIQRYWGKDGQALSRHRIDFLNFGTIPVGILACYWVVDKKSVEGLDLSGII